MYADDTVLDNFKNLYVTENSEIEKLVLDPTKIKTKSSIFNACYNTIRVKKDTKYYAGAKFTWQIV